MSRLRTHNKRKLRSAKSRPIWFDIESCLGVSFPPQMIAIRNELDEVVLNAMMVPSIHFQSVGRLSR